MNLHTIASLAAIWLLIHPSAVMGQQSTREVTRCKSVDRNMPIKNLWVDDAGVKWASNARGVYEILSCDNGTATPFGANETSALAYPYGNTDFRWDKTAMATALGADKEITCAFYDQQKKQLWIGTNKDGAYVLNTAPQLAVAERVYTGNTKLRTNQVDYIGKDHLGRFWVGTENGVIIGTPGKWKDDLSGYAFQRMRVHRNSIYVLADGEFWVVEGGDKWRAINIRERALEGDPFDFDIAEDGKMWILSRIVAHYDLNTDDYQLYSGTEYYTSEYGRFIGVDKDGAAWVATTDKGLYLIGETSTVMVAIRVDKEHDCSGGDAVLNVDASGGKPPYQYAWSDPNLKGSNPSNVPPGKHKVTVTDASGKSKSAEVSLDDPSVALAIALKKAESAPGASDGRAEATVKGGKPPYKYAWDNGESTAAASRLPEGEHRLTVTDSKGCSATGVVQVATNILPLNLELSLANPIRCQGGTATLLAITSGGKPPITFNWNNANLKGDRNDNLPAGTYNLTVTDAAGNTAKALFTIPEPAQVTGSIRVTQPGSVGKADAVASITGEGGQGGYTFAWDNGEKGAVASGLSPGTHTVTVTDRNGCTGTAAVEVKENILALTAKVRIGEPISCYEGTTALTVESFGGKGPYRFQWSSAGLQGVSPAGVSAGDYTVTITDATGQTVVESVAIRQPDLLAVVAQVMAPASAGAADGKATATPSGGNGGFVFAWDNGEKMAAATKLAPGKHTVTVTDLKGCQASFDVEVPEEILKLTVVEVKGEAIACHGGTSDLLVRVEGGKQPYQYAWSDPGVKTGKPSGVRAGEYNLTVTDASGQTVASFFKLVQPEALTVSVQVLSPATTGASDGKALATATGGNGGYRFAWDNGAQEATATGLAPGTRAVTVTDSKGCSAVGRADVREDIQPLSVSLSPLLPIDCAGGKGSLQAVVGGGKAPFQYAWSEGSLKGDKPSGLAAGKYGLTVTDAAGQRATGVFELVQPEALTVSVQVQSPATTGASDGKALATATGGNGGYRFAWDNGAQEATATGLAPGTRAVTVTDSRGCSAVGRADVREDIQPLVLTLEETQAIRCAGGLSQLQAKVRGGKPPYIYKWSNPQWSGAEASSVPPGTHSLNVADASGLTQTATFTVQAPPPIKIEVVKKTGATTERTDDGRAAIEVQGRTQPLRIAWDNGETELEARKLTQGKHRLTVTDASGCTAEATVDIGRRNLPELTPGMLSSGQTIRMEQLRFDGDSSNIKEDFLPTLNELYEFMLDNGKIVIEIGGHTNSVPPDEYCDRLSSARAKAVAEYLVTKGIDPRRVLHKGYGKRKPVASNTTPEGRALNQRVEIKILTLGG